MEVNCNYPEDDVITNNLKIEWFFVGVEGEGHAILSL